MDISPSRILHGHAPMQGSRTSSQISASDDLEVVVLQGSVPELLRAQPRPWGPSYHFQRAGPSLFGTTRLWRAAVAKMVRGQGMNWDRPPKPVSSRPAWP